MSAKRRTSINKRSASRRGSVTGGSPRLADVPYTMKLPDGRTVFVNVPGRWTTIDRGGEPAFLPPAMKFLDRVLVMAMKQPGLPSPGYLLTIREALGMTQAEFGARIGVDKMTVSRWERGTLKPSEVSLRALERLKTAAARRGVVIAA